MTKQIRLAASITALALASAAHAQPTPTKAAPKPAPRAEPKVEPKAEPKVEPKAEPAADVKQCTGRVIIGDPRFRGDEVPKPGGQSVLTDPPVPIRNLVVAGGDLHAHTLYELWTVPSIAKPETIRRYAGVHTREEKDKLRFQAGACADARFPQISGIAAGPKGSLIVTDRLANAILRVDKPGQDGCAVEVLAGPSAAAKDISPSGLASGDVDGEGTAARFRSPAHPAVDEAGNVYVLDNHSKVRRIAPDAAHTVTTVIALPSKGPGNDGFSGMTYLQGKLYVMHLESLRNSVIEIDPATGAARTVLQGNGSAYPPLNASVVPGLGGITNDGERLLITGRAYVWSLAPSGALALVAGSGKDEFKPDFDLAKARPGNEMVLPGNATNVSLAAMPGGGFLFRGRAGSYNNSYVIQVDCP